MPSIDRLSALIAGLLPRLAVYRAGDLDEVGETLPGRGQGLRIHLLVSGRVDYSDLARRQTLEAPAVAVLRDDQRHLLVNRGEEGPTILSALVGFEGPAQEVLMQAFKSPVLLGLASAGEDLAHLLALIRSELAQARCGRHALLARAGEILLITTLRHIIAHPGSAAGVLRALADPRVARAVVAMHEDPAAPWSLEALAERAGMSRTAFATTFRQHMGNTPGHYLSGLRLAIAEQSIERGEGLKRAARVAGYASPASLSRALSRRRALRSPPPAASAPRRPAA